ncbi:MAG: MBOAT family protein, partial [Bacteroidales bacterium]|nr:MBOAT family protein [Bacteroidales bacterium]
IYYVIKESYRNSFLFLSSLVFFAWGGVSYSILLIFSIIFNYFIGRKIGDSPHSKLWLTIGVIVNLSFLGVFKYADLFTETINVFLGWTQQAPLPILGILLPIGISFYTFQAISYLIDIYRKEAQVQKSIINLGLYISLFPQLIAGPIVRYHDISLQINNRNHTSDKFSEGVMRFVLGLAKKTLIANNLAIVADQVFNTPSGEISTMAAWLGLIAYTFQIYYDFAGYSDMAIGLAKMFGFDLLENFNFPYISKSIQEFWRRWHISLSSWFRDYLYIPLGGNRIGVVRTYINLFIVFFVTGLWHGSSWNFVVWGLVHGFFIVIERIGFKNVLAKTPAIISTSYTLFIAMMAWVLFRA